MPNNDQLEECDSVEVEWGSGDDQTLVPSVPPSVLTEAASLLSEGAESSPLLPAHSQLSSAQSHSSSPSIRVYTWKEICKNNFQPIEEDKLEACKLSSQNSHSAFDPFKTHPGILFTKVTQPRRYRTPRQVAAQHNFLGIYDAIDEVICLGPSLSVLSSPAAAEKDWKSLQMRNDYFSNRVRNSHDYVAKYVTKYVKKSSEGECQTPSCDFENPKSWTHFGVRSHALFTDEMSTGEGEEEGDKYEMTLVSVTFSDNPLYEIL